MEQVKYAWLDGEDQGAHQAVLRHQPGILCCLLVLFCFVQEEEEEEEPGPTWAAKDDDSDGDDDEEEKPTKLVQEDVDLTVKAAIR
jgi:hypothetical protein